MRGAISRLVTVTGPGLVLQELLYGFIMELIFVTAARIGMLDYGSKAGLCLMILGMNTTWGAIDAVVFYMIDRFGHSNHRRMILLGKNGGADREAAVDYLVDSFSATPLDALDPAEERRICGLIVDAAVETPEGMRRDRRGMMLSSAGCFIVTMLTVIPVVIPILLLDDLYEGLTLASCLSAVILFFVGYAMKDYYGVNGWAMGLFLAAMAWGMTVVATFTGGRRQQR